VYFCALTGCIAQDRIVVCTGVNELYDLDLTTCQPTLIGTSSTVFIDIAFTPNGRLWGWKDMNLYEIDPLTANDVIVGSMPGFGTASLVAWDNETLLGEFDAWLWGIRTSDGYAWRIDSIGYYASGDLTWYDGALYMTATGDPLKLIRMVLTEDLSAIQSVEVVGPFISGGQWYGVNTVMTDSCSGALVMLGFDGSAVYQISPSDASIELLCPDVFPTGTTGATSLGELRQVHGPMDLHMPNVFTPNGDGHNDMLRPMVDNDALILSMEVFNRWGNRVFDGAGLSFAWEGQTAAGEPCPEGVYYYILTYSSNCKSDRSKGYVTLLRY
jgi:gliding motility-associated-like protein